MFQSPSPDRHTSPNTGFHTPSLILPPTTHPTSPRISTTSTACGATDNDEIVYQLKTILNELKATRAAAHQRPFGWRDIFSAFAVLAGLVIGSVFGYYAKPAYSAAQQANALARESIRLTSLANVLTLTSLCYSAPPPSVSTQGLDQLTPSFPGCLADLYDADMSSLMSTTLGYGNDSTSSSAFAGNWTALVDAVVPDTLPGHNPAGGGDLSGFADDSYGMPSFFTNRTFIIVAVLVPLAVLGIFGVAIWWWNRNEPRIRAMPPGLDLRDQLKYILLGSRDKSVRA